MQQHKQTLFSVAGVLLLIFGLISFAQAQQQLPAWVSITPPLVAIGLALAVRRVLLSLFLGIVAGSILVQFTPAADTTGAISQALLQSGPYVGSLFSGIVTDSWNLQIIIFLFAILTAIAVLILAGGIKAMLRVLEPFAKGRRSAQLVTYIMGILVFIDDYANTVLVGSAMRPVADAYKISREKLAFIIDSTSAPVAGIAFISTWIGYEVGQIGSVAKSLGVARDGYAIFFDMVFFRFYCLFMLMFVLGNILSQRDYGPMAVAEARAVAGEANPHAEPQKAIAKADMVAHARVTIWSALLPIACLFVYFLGGLWLDGGGMALLEQSAWNLLSFNAWRFVVTHAEHNMLVLMQAGIVCFLVACCCAIVLARLNGRDLGKALLLGAKAAWLPTLILILAWTLKAICDALSTDAFLVSLIGGNLPAPVFPLLVFLLSGVTAIATGTSWGTMAILIPMVMPIGLALDGGSYGLYTMLSLAAVLDGAIFGDHCSPISDTTIMSSSSTGCDHMQHVVTQFPYSITVAVLAVVLGYLPVSLGLSSAWSFFFAFTALTVLFAVALPRFCKSRKLESGQPLS